MSQIARINRNVLAQLSSIIGGRPEVMPEADPRVTGLSDGPAASFMPYYDAYLRAVKVPDERVREMQYYDYLEREIPDVRKALDAFATMSTTGNLAGGGRASFTIRFVNEQNTYPETLKARLKDMEQLIRRNAFVTTRTMTKYGSYMPEIEVGQRPDGKLGVTRLRAIPPGTIFRNISREGKSDPNKYWVQVINGKVVGQDGMTVQPDGAYNAGIPQWRLPHFAVWSNVVNATETLLYGSSILQPFGAIGLKVQAALDAIVVARLSRAAMRYKWKIDVSDIPKDQAQIRSRVKKWQQLLGRGSALLNNATNTDGYQNTAVPDADFFIPAAQGLSWDLDTVDGDTNLARVGDVDLLIKFYFGALGVPPEYLGHERAQGGRSNLSQIDINFARSVRHLQLFAASGFEHVVYVDMLLAGFDPLKYPIEVLPPPIGARDDLLQAQIRGLQATVLASLRAAGMKLEKNPRWVLETFMAMDEELEGLTEEEIKDLFDEMNIQDSGPTPGGGDKKRVQEILSRQGAIVEEYRQNIKMLVRGTDDIAGGIHRHAQPTVEDLQAQISEIRKSLEANQ
jgi:hypothetical protein